MHSSAGEAKQLGAGHVRLRMRLAVDDIVGGHHRGRHGQATTLQPGGGQGARTGRDDCPGSSRDRIEQGKGAVDGNNTLRIGDLAGFKLPDFLIKR